MFNIPPKLKKLVNPSTRGAAVERGIGVGLSAAGQPAAKGDSLPGAEIRAVQDPGGRKSVAGSVPEAGKARLPADDSESSAAEPPNLKMNQPSRLRAHPAIQSGSVQTEAILIPVQMVEAICSLSRTARQLQQALSREATPEEIAEALGPGWDAARVENVRNVPHEPPPLELPNDGEEPL